MQRFVPDWIGLPTTPRRAKNSDPGWGRQLGLVGWVEALAAVKLQERRTQHHDR